MIGIIWFDETKGKQLTTEQNIKAAIEAYRAKFKGDPVKVLIHPANNGIQQVAGIPVKAQAGILRYDYEAMGSDD